MGRVLLPYQYETIKGPLIFLAGPIQGAPDWQSAAIEILSKNPAVHLASPRHSFQGEPGEYDLQVDWEHAHLARAAQDGVTLFWLAKESVCIPGRAYAQTTRVELGEAMTLHRLQGAKVVVGIEEGFSGARYLRKTLRQQAPAIPICESLEEACQRALALAIKAL